MKITDECISCSACVDECPNGAIFNAGDSYTISGESKPALNDDHTYIVAELCNSCKTCVDACAVDAIVE